MADHSNPATAIICALCSAVSSFIAWVSIKEAQVVIAFAASCLAVVSALFAITYYWYAIKEKKQNLKIKK